jgi:hypothetical protein
VRKLDLLGEQNLEETAQIVNAVNLHHATIKRLEIRNWLFENPYGNAFKFLRNQITLLIGLPFFVFGFIFNAIPFFLIDKIVRKKVKDVAFWSTFFLILGIILFPLFYGIEFLIVTGFIPGIWLKLAFLIAMPVTGKIAFKWYILFRKTIGRRRLIMLKMFHRKEYNKIFKERELLFNKLDKLISV